MAVQVLEYQQGFPKSQRDTTDASEVMTTSFQSMQQIMNLLSEKQMLLAHDAYSHIADAATSDLKKVITLLGGLGHARFRRAPGASSATRSSSPAPPSSVTLLQASAPGGSPASSRSPAQMPSSSASSQEFDIKVRFSPCHDAAEPTCSLDMHVPQGHRLQPDFPCNNEVKFDGNIPNVYKHVATDIVDANMSSKHVSQLQSSCNPFKKEQNADGSVYDASISHALHVHGHARSREAMAQKFDLQASTLKPLCGPLRSSSSFVSSMSAEEKGGTVSSGKPLYSNGRPPLPPKKRKTPEEVKEISKKCHGSAQCHCAHKRRKLKSRTMIKVSAIETMSADIPADGYSWCTYGQKSVEDSPYPRVYYKCSSVRGCPARKHVQRAPEDSNMFLVTYGRRHTHPQIHKVAVTSEGDNILF